MVNFAVPADHRMKIKENKKRDKYLDLTRELAKSRGTCITITLIPVVIGMLEMVPKSLERCLEELAIGEIGKASCRGRGLWGGGISVVTASLDKKT